MGVVTKLRALSENCIGDVLHSVSIILAAFAAVARSYCCNQTHVHMSRKLIHP